MYVELLPWQRSPYGGSLGRHVRHDPRSELYRLPAGQAASVLWDRHTPILDQDYPPEPYPQRPLGSCTGNAMVGALGTEPFWPTIHGVTLDEAEACSIYSDAEVVDGGTGLPGEDNGSSGLSVATVARRRGLISGYTHAFTVEEAYTGIAAGPLLFGVPWYNSMDRPSAEGIVTVDPYSGLRGGHEIFSRQYDASRGLWWLDNSWGTGWGVGGRFAVSDEGLHALLANQGDVTMPVPNTAPAPVPAVPVTVAFTAAEAATIQTWVNYPHSWGVAVRAARAWNAARGS